MANHLRAVGDDESASSMELDAAFLLLTTPDGTASVKDLQVLIDHCHLMTRMPDTPQTVKALAVAYAAYLNEIISDMRNTVDAGNAPLKTVPCRLSLPLFGL